MHDSLKFWRIPLPQFLDISKSRFCICFVLLFHPFTAQKTTIHQVTTMLATSKNVHFDYHPSTSECGNKSEGSSAPVVSRWLWPGNRTFLEVASMVTTWWILAFLSSDICNDIDNRRKNYLVSNTWLAVGTETQTTWTCDPTVYFYFYSLISSGENSNFAHFAAATTNHYNTINFLCSTRYWVGTV